MACNRETSADGTTSSTAPPACQNPDSLVPCCNTNCHSLGCAATMNLCSECFNEHILKEGGSVFLTKPCDASVDLSNVRLNADGAVKEAANNPCGNGRGGVNGSSAQGIEDAPAPALSSSCMGKSMNRSAGIPDLHAVYRSVQAATVGEMAGSMAVDFHEQRMPSPLSLPSSSAQVCEMGFSAVQGKVRETKLSLPPLPASRQQAVSRCLTCRKRVGLLGFKCRCGDVFCALHRYSDKHDCSFDYKAAGRAAIAKENPLVKATKIEKI